MDRMLGNRNDIVDRSSQLLQQFELDMIPNTDYWNNMREMYSHRNLSILRKKDHHMSRKLCHRVSSLDR